MGAALVIKAASRISRSSVFLMTLGLPVAMSNVVTKNGTTASEHLRSPNMATHAASRPSLWYLGRVGSARHHHGAVAKILPTH